MLWWLPSLVCFCIMNVTVTRKQTSHTQHITDRQAGSRSVGRSERRGRWTKRNRTVVQQNIFLNWARLTELSVSRGRTGASFASSPNWRIFRCFCQTLVILFTIHTGTHTLARSLTHAQWRTTHSLTASERPVSPFIGLKCENCK